MRVPSDGLAQLRQAADVNGFHRLCSFDPIAGLSAIVIGLIASFFLFGFWYPYWRVADMDLMMVYKAWLLNDGLPQEHIHHPGYLTIVLLGIWFRLLQAVGALDAYSLQALPGAANIPAYEHAWTVAVRSARVESLLIALAFVTTFYFLLQRFLRDRQVAVIGTFALAFSGGLAMHARIVRTELLSAGLITIALLVLFIAAQSPRLRIRPLLVGLAALLATLALENKVQGLLVVCALAIILLPFGRRDCDPNGFWRCSGRAWPALMVSAACAGALTVAAAPMFALAQSTNALAIADLHQLGGATVIYQIAVALWIGGGVLAFALVCDVPMSELLATAGAIVAGCAFGLLALSVYYLPQNIIVVLNPFHAMFEWASASHLELREARSLLSGAMLRNLFDGFVLTLARQTFFLQPSSRPTIFLEWLAVAGAIMTYRRGERRLALQIGILIAAALVIDAIGMLRGLKIEYFIFTDPLIVIATCLLLVELPELRTSVGSYQVGVALIAAHILISHAEPVKHAFKNSGPEGACNFQSGYFTRLEPFPFCAAPH